MKNITIKDPFCIIFFRFSDFESLSIKSYFNCLRNLKPLFKDSKFIESTPSFYLNHILNGSDDNGISLRCTYFTSSNDITKFIIDNFLKKNNEIALFPSRDGKENIKKNAASDKPDEELRFRKFAYAYSNIGLDMIDNNITLDFFRKILANYMKTYYDSLCQIGGFPVSGKLDAINPGIFFNDFLIKYSYFFREKLDFHARNQFWEDLAYCPNANICFPHFLANMFCVSDTGYIVND